MKVKFEDLIRRIRPKLILAFSFVIASRVVGIGRELIIAGGFGFSRQTDLFYQLIAPINYVSTYMAGPFTTALIATLSDGVRGDRGAIGLSRIVFFISCLSAVISGIVSWWFVPGGGLQRIGVSASVAVAFAATIWLGFCASILNARSEFAKSQGVLFAVNTAFVVLAATLMVLKPAAVTVVLMIAFAASCTAGCIVGQRAGRLSLSNNLAERGALKRFSGALAYASMETGGFLATQAVVLFCATVSGVGMVSASALAQRLAFSFNGLIIGPLATMIMVKLVENENERKRIITVSVIGVLITLTLVSTLLYGAGIPAISLVEGQGNFSSDNAAIMSEILPAYCVWLVAQGISALLSRAMFALGMGRQFTIVTTSGYILANAVRLALVHDRGFSEAVACGALVELVVALGLAFYAVRRSQ